MTDRLRIPSQFGMETDELRKQETAAVQGRVNRLERGWQVWDQLAWTASTTDPAIGNGTLAGWYKFDDRWLELWVEMTAGSTTTFGSGAWIISGQPVPLDPVLPQGAMVGQFGARDSGTASYAGVVITDSTDGQLLPRVLQYSGANGTVTSVSSTSPLTWGSGDSFTIWCKFRYRD